MPDASPRDGHDLSIVMPVYNEREWAPKAIRRAADELDGTSWSAEFVVVDDGSTDGTSEVLDRLDPGHPISVIHQENSGRFAARRTGVERARGTWVLLLDSRVLLHPGSLAFVEGRLSEDAQVWNAHVEMEVTGNPYAGFWHTATALAWSDYLEQPRTVSYGIEDFDRYPKGTTAFVAPRELLWEGIEQFTTYYSDARLSNDDTSIIRWIAERHRIWISPGFGCQYEPRDTFSKFVRHAYHRGTVFVDGHLRAGARFAPFIVLFYLLSSLALMSGAWEPWMPLVMLVAAGLAAAVLVRVRGLGWQAATTVATLTPVFIVAYGLGMWRGLVLLVKSKLGS